MLDGIGNAALLQSPLAAFFASWQCPGKAIRAAMDWAVAQARAGNTVVSGFHSSLEQSVLKVMLVAKAPAVLVLARPVRGARLPAEWMDAMRAQHLLVVSSAGALAAPRLIAEAARERNELAACLASRIVIAHAAPNGQLARQMAAWQVSGAVLELLDKD